MALRTHCKSGIKQHQTGTHIFKLFSQLEILSNTIETQPELIGKLVISDNPNQFLLAVSILTKGDKSTIF